MFILKIKLVEGRSYLYFLINIFEGGAIFILKNDLIERPVRNMAVQETVRTTCSKPRVPFATFRTPRSTRCEE